MKKNNNNYQLLSLYCVPGSVLSIFHTLSLLTFVATPCALYCFDSIIIPHYYGDFQ